MVSTPEILAGNLRTIVAATDLSDTAAAALQWAKAIAIDHRAALHITSCVKPIHDFEFF